MKPSPDEPLLTEWTRIEGRDFEHFFQKYWSPVRRFVARRLPSVEESEEVTQELFYAFLERDFLGRADARKGSFRKFLFHAARQFLIDRYRAASAQKRGAGRVVPLEAVGDAESGEDLGEESFDQEWYASLFNRARRRLKEHYYGRGRPECYRAFRLFCFGKSGSEVTWSQKDIAEELDLTLAQVKNFVHRGKAVFAKEIRLSISEYVTREEDVEAELHDLAQFLGSHRVLDFSASSIHAKSEEGEEDC